MGQFLTGSGLAAQIKKVMAGTEARCAVAFIGKIAPEVIGKSGTKIVCDISMGGTYPKALVALGAPNNDLLRYSNGLHAKVYISEAGVVIGSANASEGALGRGDEPRLAEVGTYHPVDSAVWNDASIWIEKFFACAKPIDAEALDRAKNIWQPGMLESELQEPPQPGSLLQLVRNDPMRFKNIGFVFVKRVADLVQAEEDAQEFEGNPPEAPVTLPSTTFNSFTNWSQEDFQRWPRFFFEFWMPRANLRVFARENIACHGNTLFSKRVRLKVFGSTFESLPSLTAINEADRDCCAQILSQNRDFGRLFDAFELQKFLYELQRQTASP